MLPDTIWPGTDDEFMEWHTVLMRLMLQKDPPCGCQPALFDMDGGHETPSVSCSTHRAATQDQRWLNGLVMFRRKRFRLLHEEGVEP